MRSPVSTRSKAFAREPLRRTCPVRIQRWSMLRARPSLRAKNCVIFWPASSALTVNAQGSGREGGGVISAKNLSNSRQAALSIMTADAARTIQGPQTAGRAFPVVVVVIVMMCAGTPPVGAFVASKGLAVAQGALPKPRMGQSSAQQYYQHQTENDTDLTCRTHAKSPLAGYCSPKLANPYPARGFYAIKPYWSFQTQFSR